MFASSVLPVLAAIISTYVVNADVTPLTPAPGDVFNAGTPCTTTWAGDSSSTTAWKNMAIEMMTGANLEMVHLTTVATNQDGTTGGQFQFTCPDVDIHAAIYFFQYSAPNAANRTWTTRFTIASSTGETTDPPNATQPGSNDPIPWGIGSLLDPSSAIAAPSFAASNSGSGPTAINTGSLSVSATSLTTSSQPSSSAPSSSSPSLSPSSSSPSPSTSAASQQTSANAAQSNVVFDSRAWQAGTALVASAFAFSVLL